MIARAEGSIDDEDEVDFVVIGSGAGGGPLAANLALAGFSVAVLEAGSEHVCDYYTVPIMQAHASEDAAMRWDFFVRHYGDENRAAEDTKWVPEQCGILYPRGSTIGGSTAISAMVHIAPQDRDWDRLAALTKDSTWDAAHMREIFERIEHWQGVDAQPLPGDSDEDRDAKAHHGHDGWLATTRADPSIAGREPLFLDIINATERLSRAEFGIPEDVPLPRDINARDTDASFQGMSFVPVAAGGGQRNGSRERLQSVAAQHPDRLRIMTEALVERVIIENGRATGAQYLQGEKLYRAAPGAATTQPQSRAIIRARREVIISAGAFNTPQLLMLSGIGPRGALEAQGISVIVDAPGVGRNLHDRYEVSVVSELESDYALFQGATLGLPTPAASEDPLMREWRDTAGGPYSTNGSLAAIVTKTSAAAGMESDAILFSLPIDFRGYYPGYASDSAQHHDRLSVLVLKGYTNNRAGSVTLRSADPRDTPAIHMRSFDEGSPGWEEDVDGVVDGIQLARKLIATLQSTAVVSELIPGQCIRDRDELRDFVKREAWGHHACGTAKIGTSEDPMAVLDGDFRVRGVEALRVVDASVFPDIPGFFIVSAVYMASEKASDVLLQKHATG